MGVRIIAVVAIVLLLAGCGGAGGGDALTNTGGGTNYVPPVMDGPTSTLDLGGVPIGSGMDLMSENTMCLLCSVQNTYNENYGAGQAGSNTTTDVTNSGERAVADLSTTDGAAAFCYDTELGIFKQGGCVTK